MSAFDVYCVMQANRVVGVSLVLSLAAVLAIPFLMIEITEGNPKNRPVAKRILIALVAVLSITVPAAVFTPDTRTLSLMYVLPAIANDEDFRRDAKEIYSLAVDGLKDALAE